LAVHEKIWFRFGSDWGKISIRRPDSNSLQKVTAKERDRKNIVKILRKLALNWHDKRLVFLSLSIYSRCLRQFSFRFEAQSVHFISRKIYISLGPIDDLASKPINYGKETKGKDHF